MKFRPLAAAFAVVASLMVSGPAFAEDSIGEKIDKIDAALKDKARLKSLKLDNDDIKEIKSLRDEGAEAEKAGDTERALPLLQQAFDILGLE